jgi:epsilon-lactone hydrolase
MILKNLVSELLERLVLAFPDKIRLAGNKTIARAVPNSPEKVRLITLEGSGHEPELSGFLGRRIQHSSSVLGQSFWNSLHGSSITRFSLIAMGRAAWHTTFWRAFGTRDSQPISRKVLALTIALTASAWNGAALTQEAASTHEAASRRIPSRILPVPDTVSPALQRLIGQAPSPPPKLPKTAEEWKALVEPPPDFSQRLAEMRDKFGVTFAPQVVGGVRCYMVRPKVVKPNNRNRLLFYLHHGGFVWGAGEAGLPEAIVMAGLTGYEVILVDYRLLPDHPFPAAMDDAVAVWKEVIKLAKPGNIAAFGSSVGGSMVLSLVQRAKKEGLPLPGAVMSGTPWSDLSKTGDSYYTNDGVDGDISYDGFWEAVAKLYANGRDLKDPLLSPVYGDFSGFPPTFLVTGTRDLFLSNTVRVQSKLLQAGVPTQLEVEEGQHHFEYLDAALVDAPEGAELYLHIGRFFDAHLGR